ncbi:helix-turn-helix domain-containing protein [Pseudonocardia adelaidensis]|uniref:Helix-turn-helix domain-containing protein n=1 Tax=Pseudonocardia adelaidensis TaxID=648754 RepID=A0ABP9NQ62_9PSEU
MVTMLVPHRAPAIDLGITTALFGSSHPLGGNAKGWYEPRLCAPVLDHAGQVSNPVVETANDLNMLTDVHTIIVAAGPEVPPDPAPAVLQALQAARIRGVRISALGTGTFVLAAAGLLTGLRATAHWSVCEELRRRYPKIVVDDQALYVEDAGIFTCAGAAATLDLCLELIRRDHGAAVANALARWMIAPPQRLGDHRQFVSAPVGESGESLVRVLEWASSRLAEQITLADMAEVAGLSPRTLSRRFHAALGTSPLQWLLAQRIRLAQELLESSQETAEQIARLAGFGSVGNLRQHFTRVLGVSPQRYRRVRRSRDTNG